MSSWLTKLLALVAAIGSGLALIFRAKSKQHQAEAKVDEQRAESAEAVSDLHRRVDDARDEVQQRHREEQEVIEQSLQEGKRVQLDNKW